MLSESKEKINIVIWGPSLKDMWEQIFTNLLNDNQVLVELLAPSDIFANTRPYPLNFDHVPSISPNQLPTFGDASRHSILNGKSGEVQRSPTYPWSLPDEISLKQSRQFKNLQLLTLKPPHDGKAWDDLQHQQQFELVSSAFESFLGVDGVRQFKIEKVVLLHNPTIENKFVLTYNDTVNRQDSTVHKEKPNKNKLWQEAIMAKVYSFLGISLW